MRFIRTYNIGAGVSTNEYGGVDSHGYGHSMAEAEADLSKKRDLFEYLQPLRAKLANALKIDCTDAYFTAHRIIDGEQHTLAVVDGQPVWRKGDA